MNLYHNEQSLNEWNTVVMILNVFSLSYNTSTEETLKNEVSTLHSVHYDTMNQQWPASHLWTCHFYNLTITICFIQPSTSAILFSCFFFLPFQQAKSRADHYTSAKTKESQFKLQSKMSACQCLFRNIVKLFSWLHPTQLGVCLCYFTVSLQWSLEQKQTKCNNNTAHNSFTYRVDEGRWAASVVDNKFKIKNQTLNFFLKVILVLLYNVSA